MTRMLIAALGLLSLSGAAFAQSEEAACRAAIHDARLFAATLPADHLSRRFAEHELDSAEMEMQAGEVDECPEMVERARHIVETKPYVLREGETLGVHPQAPGH